MRLALLGAGIIGTVIARDLASWDGPHEVVVGDLDEERARGVAAEHGFESAAVDVRDSQSLDAFLGGGDVVINAAQYQLNLEVMEGALRARCQYLDLGGLFHTTRRQLELDGKFRAAGRTAVLGIGSCPGIANVHAADLANGSTRFGRCGSSMGPPSIRPTL
ncbi:MAG: saccharopine dehydrogenase NADP-binding domain-containing protein [Acidimicrobiia bacterium]